MSNVSLRIPRLRRGSVRGVGVALLLALTGTLGAPAITAQPVINEFVFNHTGTDTNEFIEIAGPASTDLSAFTVLEIEGDGTGAGTLDGVFPVGTTDAAGIFATGFLNNALENGTVTLLLVQGFTGSQGTDLDTDNDGLLDVAPWSLLVDSVAVSDGGSSDHTYAELVLAGGFDGVPFTVGGASRIPNGQDTDSVADWTRNDFDGAGIPALDPGSPDVGEALNTPGAVNALVGAAAADPVINEFVFNHTGTDTNEFIEIAGDPVADYTGFTVLEIEGDGSGAGTVDGVFDLATTDGNGLELFGFFNNALENGTITLLLVENFTGAVSDDLDTDNDGVLDTLPWDRVVDSVAVSDGGASDQTYADVVLAGGFDGVPFTVGGASRIPNGQDTDSVADWLRNDFSGAGIPALEPGSPEVGEAFNTPGAINQAVQAPLPVVALNEIRIDQPGGDDDEYFELLGVPGDSLDRLTYVVIGDGAGGSGVVEAVVDLTGQVIPGDGFFVTAESTFTLGVADFTATLGFENSDNVTHLLVADFTGSNGDDLDTDDDGILDTVPWSTRLDCVALVESPGSGDQIYCTTTVGPDGSFVPGHAFFCEEDGWRIGDFGTGSTDSPGEANPCDPVVVEAEIFEIQGSGFSSPLEGQTVLTADNIVTGVTPDGFFIQTPPERTDGDAATSDGIFVFTNGASGVTAGDRVTVTGVVVEFFDLTEIGGGPTVTLLSGGSPLPSPVTLDVNTPSPLPPGGDLEALEGMRVRLENGLATGPTDFFGDLPVVAGADRAFREPGIEFPGLPGLPVWDGNPEVFEIDPDGLAGQPDFAVDALKPVTVAQGPLSFAFGDYQILPDTLAFGTAPPLPVPVRAASPDELTVGSLNFFRLFDDVDDPGSEDNGQVASTLEYQLRLEKFSAYVRRVLGSPDVLAVQEVESVGVLQDLAARIAADDPAVAYHAFLVEGNDVGGIDVGFLVRQRVRVDAVTQLAADEILTFDGSLLHDRPPLLLEGALLTGGEDFEIAVLVIHNRSLNGIEDAGSGPRVRQKRLEQAQSIADQVQLFQQADPGAFLTVVGDFNAFEFTDGFVDVVGQIAGDFDPADNLLSGSDIVDPNLIKTVLGLSALDRYSFIFGGSAQVLDHALVTSTLAPLVTGLEYGRGNADAAVARENELGDPSVDADPEAVSALRSSDHDGLVLFVFADSDNDGIANSADACPGTVIPEGVPTQRLGTNRWALVDGDGVFDTAGPGAGGAGFTLEDTAGCSCEQIIEERALGLGHEQFGCSTGVLRSWVQEVHP